MTSLTRTVGRNKLSIIEYAASLTNGPVIWAFERGNTLAGVNVVTFDPYRLPGYKLYIKNGSSATTNLEGTEWTFNDGNFVFAQHRGQFFPQELPQWQWNRYWTGVKGNPLVYGSLPSNETSSVERADNAARSIFAMRCYHARTQLQSGVVLGELGKTISMISSPMSGLYRGVGSYLGQVKKLARGNKSAASKRKSLDTAADLWLEYSYGWKPLIHDLKDASKAVGQLSQTGVSRKRVSGSGSDSTNFPSGPQTRNEGAGRVVTYRVNQRSTSSVRYTGAVICKIDTLGRSMEVLGADWPSFIPSLWELIPYSFLVDYFTNAGEIVTALSNPRSSLAWVERGIMFESTCEVDVQGCTFPPFVLNESLLSANMSGASGSVSKKTVYRSPYTGDLIPVLQFSIPTRKAQWLNMAALAVTHSSVLRAIF